MNFLEGSKLSDADRVVIRNRVNALQNAINNWPTLTPANKDQVLFGISQGILVLYKMLILDE
jgi:hypothetical protein